MRQQSHRTGTLSGLLYVYSGMAESRGLPLCRFCLYRQGVSLTRISYYPLSHTNSRVPIASEDMHKDDMPMGDGRFARVVLFAVCG